MDSSSPDSAQRPPGRIRSAWQVLLGQRLVPAQIEAEWAEYQLIFGDILKRFSALLAREAKAERKRLSRLQEDSDPAPQLELLPRGRAKKAELRSLAADRLGLGPLRQKLHHQPTEAEEEAG